MLIKERLEQANSDFFGNRLAEAAAGYEAVVAEAPEQADAWHGLALTAWRQGQQDKAEAAIRRALELVPDSVSYLCTLGDILRLAGRHDEARQTLENALSFDPKSAIAHHNLGMIHLDRKDWMDGVKAFAAAAEVAPGMAMAFYNLGIALRELHHPEEAILAFRKALEIDPNFVEAHIDLGLTLLLDGQWEEGFKEYEWRLRRDDLNVPSGVDAPVWDGWTDSSKTLLVCAEQGLGDTLQFVRYLPFIAKEGMSVVLQCQPALLELLQSVEGITYTCEQGEMPGQVDAQIPLLSLPGLFNTHVGRVPANVPYLRAPYGKLKRWQERLDALGETIKVGLRWSGNPANSRDAERSVPLDLFAGLADLPQVTFISLQDKPWSEEEGKVAEAIGLIDYSAELRDFTDTAALVSNLDLVISVDTAVLHLAGALGVSAWGLIRYTPHWVWLLEGESSLWYPSLRLYRQPAEGDWLSVMSRVTANLWGLMEHLLADKAGQKGAEGV